MTGLLAAGAVSVAAAETVTGCVVSTGAVVTGVLSGFSVADCDACSGSAAGWGAVAVDCAEVCRGTVPPEAPGARTVGAAGAAVAAAV
ncbi:MAG: hypothetical protein IJQ91_03730 [Acidaminococcaceae bacterium]|nr:hypothetical protein [Acidaminococcaceae bacterium]